MSPPVLRCGELAPEALAALLARWGLEVATVAPDAPIPGSFWGEPEAGVEGPRLWIRPDTPVHSALHEAGHAICSRAAGRGAFDTDAGGDAVEECAVCYLQVLLAEQLPGVGAARLMADMDAWGYSFRLGSTAAWFADDAADAREWLREHGILDGRDRPRPAHEASVPAVKELRCP